MNKIKYYQTLTF